MTTEAGFLQALRDNPADDDTRLIFADWLDERGDPRGEFLRLQLALARWEPDAEARRALHRRCRELLAEHAGAWLGPLATHCAEVVWERGQPHLTVTAKTFASSWFTKEAPALLARAMVGRVRVLPGTPAVQTRLLGSPLFEHLPHLALEGFALDDADLASLLANPHCRGFRSLSLANNELGDAGVQRLLASPAAAVLERLDLRNNRLRDDAWWDLAAWEGAARLRDLDATGNLLGPAAWDDLTAWRAGRLARHTGGERVVNSLGMEFVAIPPGFYRRGSDTSDAARYDDELPRRTVGITRGFHLAAFQVTQAQYLRVVGHNPARFHAANGGGLNHPVEMVSWEEAAEFCARVSALPAEQAAGRRYRLPTESEWEHAARAGWDDAALPWNREPTPWLANYGENVGLTVPVGSYPPTPWGLYDLSGNLWDWCADWYGAYTKGSRVLLDPKGPRRGSQRVLRGGSWYGPGRNVRCACRGSDSPTTHDHYYGFRLLLETRPRS